MKCTAKKISTTALWNAIACSSKKSSKNNGVELRV